MHVRRGAAMAALTLALGAATAGSAGAHGGDDDAGAHGKVPSGAFGPLTAPFALEDGATLIGGDNGFPGGHVAIEGDRLYLGSYGIGLRIYDIAGENRRRPALLGTYSAGNGGLRADAPPDAARYGDREIAVLNGTRRVSSGPDDYRTDRTEWLDTTDPANPRLLHTAGPDQVDGESHNGDIVDERKIYLPSGGSAAGRSNGNVSQGLRIYDLRPTIRTPAEDCRPDAGEWDEKARTGNPCAPRNVFRGDPVEMWEASPFRGDRPVGRPFTHTHDITVYTDRRVKGLPGPRDIALLAEGGNYTDNGGDTGSVFVIDITDPRQPVVLLRWLHDRGEGHHPIRYHHEAQFLDGQPNVMLVTDEDMHNGCGNAGGVVAVDLGDDLRTPRELSEWFIPAGTPAPVCSVHVFSSEGDDVFLGSYNAGLQVVGYEDPRKPVQKASAIAAGTTAWGAQIHEDVVYVGDMARGLDVFELDAGDPAPARGGR